MAQKKLLRVIDLQTAEKADPLMNKIPVKKAKKGMWIRVVEHPNGLIQYGTYNNESGWIVAPCNTPLFKKVVNNDDYACQMMDKPFEKAPYWAKEQA